MLEGVDIKNYKDKAARLFLNYDPTDVQWNQEVDVEHVAADVYLLYIRAYLIDIYPELIYLHSDEFRKWSIAVTELSLIHHLHLTEFIAQKCYDYAELSERSSPEAIDIMVHSIEQRIRGNLSIHPKDEAGHIEVTKLISLMDILGEVDGSNPKLNFAMKVLQEDLRNSNGHVTPDTLIQYILRASKSPGDMGKRVQQHIHPPFNDRLVLIDKLMTAYIAQETIGEYSDYTTSSFSSRQSKSSLGLASLFKSLKHLDSKS